MEDHNWLVARDKPGLLIAMMRALAGDSQISFEGDLSQCAEVFSLPGASTLETDSLKRQTIYPIQDFVILPLDPGSIRPILDVVLTGSLLVHEIVHVQIAKHGRLAFGAYDNFHRDCVVAWSQVPHVLLCELKSSGVLRSIQRAPSDGNVKT